MPDGDLNVSLRLNPTLLKFTLELSYEAIL